MTTNFPSGLDAFTNPSATDAMDSVTVPHASQHADLNDAMEAVQTKLGVGAGTIGTWTSYTPTLTNFTVNSLTARYARVNNLVYLTLGFSVVSVSGVPVISLPVAGQYTQPFAGGTVTFLDQGAGWFFGLSNNNGTNLEIYGSLASTTYLGLAATSSTVPFTWATNDGIFCHTWYEAA